MTETTTTLRDDVEACRRDTERFLASAVEDAGADGVVLGLSGGLDSTVTAQLATQALGASDVVGLSLPTAASSRRNTEDARRVADDLDVSFRCIDLQQPLDAVHEALGTDLPAPEDAAVGGRPDGAPGAVVPGNVAARLRMTALYCEANRSNRLVVGTGNRTELLLGYFTKYGDGGVDLLPLGDLYKTEVRRLARHVGVDETIVRKPPTAGLWEGQRDADEIGAPYEIVDEVLNLAVDHQVSPAVVAEWTDADAERVEAILTMVDANRHKRSTPPTPETYGERWLSAASADLDVRLTGSETLSDVHMQHIVDLIDRPPSLVGFEARRWTPELVQRYLAEAYGITYPLGRIERLLDGLEHSADPGA